jgi:DNA-directed RNA polymerase specialized sigma24 family protein
VGGSIEELPDPRPDAAWRLSTKATLSALWREVGELPPRQRAALLLSLRDEQGGTALLLFPVTGTATIRQIAEALHLGPERFAELWNALPLDDRRIAELLGVTRQQVINLRKAARERLTRRLAARGRIE